MSRCHPLAFACLLSLAVPVAAQAGTYDKDYSAYARNILPSGQYGAPGIAGADRQAKMFDALTYRFDKVTDADLTADFKSESFGVGGDGPGKVEKGLPRKDVTITRDAFDVPHVKAKSYDAGIWAGGWIAAEDRGLLLEQARYNSRIAAVDAPGMSALKLITGLKTFVPSKQTETELAAQTKTLLNAGKDGRRVLRDIDTFLKGVNAYLKKSKSPNKPWTRNDIYAVTALKGQFLGQGGGDEVRRSQLLAALQARVGGTAGAAGVALKLSGSRITLPLGSLGICP